MPFWLLSGNAGGRSTWTAGAIYSYYTLSTHVLTLEDVGPDDACHDGQHLGPVRVGGQDLQVDEVCACVGG